ncbi:hypothetical protein Ae706Ps2_5143 [Pseudonocardia sp. Ae706_Ps2]|nr:hypothetical protein Ae706Ps2_5143 [Pseudonocardia sp. Ae706_Ps2]
MILPPSGPSVTRHPHHGVRTWSPGGDRPVDRRE